MRTPVLARLSCWSPITSMDTIPSPSKIQTPSELLIELGLPPISPSLANPQNQQPNAPLPSTSSSESQLNTQPTSLSSHFEPREVDEIENVLMFLNNSRADDYLSWIQIGMALHNEDENLLHVWENWSAKSD